jgi:hypothetical protein
MLLVYCIINYLTSPPPGPAHPQRQWGDPDWAKGYQGAGAGQRLPPHPSVDLRKSEQRGRRRWMGAFCTAQSREDMHRRKSKVGGGGG